jgi:stage II sporulation protein D
MRRIVLVTTLCCLPVPLGVLAPAAAEAASVVVVRGAGFGHGIGMSQYGAYGYAKKGMKWQDILAHYYTGTALSNAPSRPVRVLLRSGASSVRFRGASVGPGGRKLNPRKTYTVTAAGGKVRLGGVGTFSAPLRVKRSGGAVTLLGTAINGITAGRYRGVLEFRGSSGVSAVNSLPIDSYARGVIAGEMPSEWSMDALRAQAVAARTYALATRNTKGGSFDLYPDTRSQVYNGVRGETRRTNLAVRETANKVVTYKGKIATTYFFSTSGGKTENIENSFLGSTPQPWLKSVDDPYDNLSPKHRWTRRFSRSSFGSRLGVPGSFRSITVLKRGRSPRIIQARISGSGGSKTITGPQIRSRLGLYDTWASFTDVSSSQARTPAGMARTARTRGWVTGRFNPAPRDRELVFERRLAGGSWQRVALVATDSRGRFRAAAPRRGVYRVRAGAIAGAATRVR